MAREGALWMGDLADYMDENFIIAAFRALGEENVQNVKVMKNRYTGHPAGYCFVNFNSDQAALTAMHKLNGKVIPHSQPPVRFKLNHSSTRGNTTDKEFSLWVGDLTPDVDDFALYKTFGSRYNSIKTAKVIYDPNGQSKGFAFVRFYSEDEYKDALTHMNGFKGLGQKPLKVSYAVPKKQHYPGMNPMGGDYSQYYEQYWNNYAAWQNYNAYYDPYSSSYGDYSTGIEGGSGDSKDASKEDFEPVEWNVPIDIDKANKEYIDRSEELWQAIEKARWNFWDEGTKEEE
ncbi:tRNA selenocysteine 1-associated protein 1-like isoform X2 [Palaemon carinicauda]|uniref:tRNA selenocysteine 1-associated protein 1-like isoform X2 n=1 Tax=Palaemon carinicauda TaxID=392227 RepID=UPI0035B64F46